MNDRAERRYLTTEEVATRFRTSAGTARYWRHVGRGPKSFRVGRRVLYRLDEVERWERDLETAEHSRASGGAA